MNSRPRHASRSSRTSRQPAQDVFFPAAAAYAALVAPLSVNGMLTGQPIVPAFSTTLGHAHELLFGFALAVVTGFLVTRATRLTIGALFTLWSGARLAFLLAPDSYVATAFNVGFVIYLTAIVVPPFMKAAKRWRNRAIGPILLAAVGSLLAFHAARHGQLPVLGHLALREAVLALILLMLFMGGRIIAPAAAGHMRLLGGHLEARVQPRLEGALLLLLAAAMITSPVPALFPVSAALLFASGIVTLIRLFRWRLWLCIDRDDLTGLGIGYAWLAIGLLLLGSAVATGIPTTRTALHAITLGALGTLTITVMTRTRRVRFKRDPARLPGIPIALGAIAAATLLRIGWPTTADVLMASSLLWSTAFIIALVTLLQSRPHPTR